MSKANVNSCLKPIKQTIYMMTSLIKFIIILLSVLNVASPITIFDGRDNLGKTAITSNVLQMFERLRIRMHMDMTDIGITRLDPLSVNKVVLQKEFLEGASLAMTNIKMVGLKSFIIHEVDVNIFGMEFRFDFTVPTLAFNGNYEADGVLGKMIPFEGKGPFSIELSNVTLKCDGRLRYENDNWSVPDLNIYLAIDEFKGGFDQLSNTLLTEILNEAGPEILKEIWPMVEPSVVIQTKKIILRQLGHSSLENFINILYHGDIEWPTVEMKN